MDEAILQAPEGATSCNYDGNEYVVEDGLVAVPHAAVADLLAHGYTVAVEQEPTTPPAKGKKGK